MGSIQFINHINNGRTNLAFLRLYGITTVSIDNVSVKEVVQDTGDFTFSRPSGATRVNSDGLIEEVSLLGDELTINGGFDTGIRDGTK